MSAEPSTTPAPRPVRSGLPARRRPRLAAAAAAAAAAALAAVACVAAVPARASTSDLAAASCAAAGSSIPAAATRFGGNIFSAGGGEAEALHSPLDVAQHPGSGWKTGLFSSGLHYLLLMQDDGNLVMYSVEYTGEVWCAGGAAYYTYRDLGPVWASGVNYPWGSLEPTRAVMQADGNLVTYTGSTATWASGTNDWFLSPGYDLAVQDDGNLVIYWWYTPLWDRYNGRLQ